MGRRCFRSCGGLSPRRQLRKQHFPKQLRSMLLPKQLLNRYFPKQLQLFKQHFLKQLFTRYFPKQFQLFNQHFPKRIFRRRLVFPHKLQFLCGQHSELPQRCSTLHRTRKTRRWRMKLNSQKRVPRRGAVWRTRVLRRAAACPHAGSLSPRHMVHASRPVPSHSWKGDLAAVALFVVLRRGVAQEKTLRQGRTVGKFHQEAL